MTLRQSNNTGDVDVIAQAAQDFDGLPQRVTKEHTQTEFIGQVSEHGYADTRTELESKLRYTKLALLQKALDNPDINERIGSAWRLFFMLIFSPNGTVLATYAEIADKLGVVTKTIRNWAEVLEQTEMICKEPKGHGVKLSLCDNFRNIAQAPEYIVQTIEANNPQNDDDPQLQALLNIGRVACSRGSKIEVKLVI